MAPFLLLLGLIPGLILVAAVTFERWRRKNRGERSPLSEELLRPVGYNLQLKIEELSAKFDSWFMATFILAWADVGIFSFVNRIQFAIVFGLAAAFSTVIAFRIVLEIAAYRRGLLGEQAMAEYLQPLIADGYQIFHDVPSDDKWNIDHVVVGSAGVFAIETKYRTKKPAKDGKRDCDAVFDGSRIQFASGDYDSNAVGQARNNAVWLAKTLSKATGGRVTVQAMVALPGWYVTLKANSDVKVLSGKQVSGFISTEPAQLSEKAIQQIIYQLDQRCRDVAY
ncbi:MAG TPA: nuclease-related domain-containing protein [Verrucomicrobiae bacterium]